MKILYKIKYNSDKHNMTNATKHIVAGTTIDAPPATLQIVSYEEDPNGFYLIHYKEDGTEITDTYHDSVQDAMEQAEFEFEIKKGDWQQC